MTTCLPALLMVLAFTPFLGMGQGVSQPRSDTPISLPAGTPLPVEIDENLSMRAGIAVRAHLLYPVYSGGTLVLPAQTVLLGKVTALEPDRPRRMRARLNADFTPFYTPVVQFTEIVLTDGTVVPLSSGTATDGAPIFRIVAPPPQTGGFLHRQFASVSTAAKDRIHIVTGPDKGDRLKQLFYSQLPYHPQRIAKGTAWTVESSAPLLIAQMPAQPVFAVKPAATSDAPATWMVQAYLNDALTSATTKAGQEIRATVAEPIYNPDGTVAVPQGATLVGAVTKAKPARRMARAGELSFSFRQLILPGEGPQAVQTSLVGADASSSADLAMNSEGEVKPKPQDKVIVPLLLLALARGPLDHENNGSMVGRNTAASNSLGTIGFVVGAAAQSTYLAAGLGYYGAAIAIYDRIFARGKQVTFAHDTRIVLQTTTRRSAPMKTVATAAPPR